MSAVALQREPWITDERTVRLSIVGAPLLYTASGKAPIQPHSVTLTYDIPGAAVTSVTVVGLPTVERAGGRGYVRRRVDPDWAPAWVWNLIDEYRP